MPLDFKKLGDRDVSPENFKKNTSSKSPIRESYSPPPRAKTPEKPKISSNQRQINNEYKFY